MKLKRNIVKICDMKQRDDGFVPGTPAERLGYMWELTKELWSLRNPQDAERRLQRNVTKLIRQQD